MTEYEGYCVKCRKKVPIKDGHEVVWKNGMKVWTGVCPYCGTKVTRILGKA